jgi:Fe-S cluster biogenesis protein NfuA
LRLPGKSAIYCARSAAGASARCRFLWETGNVHPDRGHTESGDPEIPARTGGFGKRLFGISGVSGVFFGADFIAVTKSGGEWQQLKPMILGAIMEHFMSGEPLIARGEAEPSDGGEFFETVDAETVATIKDLIETRVRPAVANDGGDITFRGFKDGIVYLNMKGACSGCPSSTATLRHGIQNLLRHYIPEVTEVRPV